MKNHKKIKLYPRGETLIEVIVSLTVVMFAGAAAASILITAFRTTALSEDYLIAQNLANEAVEMVLNVRDTNHLRFPLYLEECWAIYDLSSSAECDGGTPSVYFSAGQNYYIYFDNSSGQWQFAQDSHTFDHPNFKLYIDKTITPTSLNIYNDPAQCTPPACEFSGFSRVIQVLDVSEEEIKFEVTVQWEKAGGDKATFSTGEVIVSNYI